MSKLVLYLDESGNSGDAIPKNNTDPFSGQPSFALAGVGFTQEHKLDNFVQKLKIKYKVQAPDLKASHVFKKPGFIQELLQIIIDNEHPLFIELMDKKYFIAANILQFYVIRELALQSPFFANLGKDLAGVLADNFDNTVFIYYGQMCRYPSKESFIQFARSLYQECVDAINKGVYNSQLLSLLIIKVGMDLENIQSGDLDESIIERFIPPADQNKRGEVIAMLPHVNAFTNIYARINHFVSKDLELEIIHDEQAYFDDILKIWEKTLTTNELSHILIQSYHSNVNYIFDKKFSFKFGKSDVYIGIQVADVIAGFCTRYFNQIQANWLDEPSAYKEIVHLLMELSNKQNSQGLNIIASQASIKKFYSM